MGMSSQGLLLVWQLFTESAVEDNKCEILFMESIQESIQQFSTVYPEAHVYVWLLKKYIY